LNGKLKIENKKAQSTQFIFSFTFNNSDVISPLPQIKPADEPLIPFSPFALQNGMESEPKLSTAPSSFFNENEEPVESKAENKQSSLENTNPPPVESQQLATDC
jgi:hypothetical protein